MLLLGRYSWELLSLVIHCHHENTFLLNAVICWVCWSGLSQTWWRMMILWCYSLEKSCSMLLPSVWVHPIPIRGWYVCRYTFSGTCGIPLSSHCFVACMVVNGWKILCLISWWLPWEFILELCPIIHQDLDTSSKVAVNVVQICFRNLFSCFCFQWYAPCKPCKHTNSC